MQTEIFSIAEKLLPVYKTEDFELLLSKLTDGEHPSLKILVKMELKRLMSPCYRSIDLRGRVKGECREYELDGITHWLDDVAFNTYHKNVRKYHGYTEGVFDALSNTRNSFKVINQNAQPKPIENEETTNVFNAEPVVMGFDLKRKENRLKLSTQIVIHLSNEQLVHGVTSDISPSGGKFKVPSAFHYKLGEVITIQFSELAKSTSIGKITESICYRIVGIDESFENDAVNFLRVIRLDNAELINNIMAYCLHNQVQRSRHDNQDKVVRARSRGYEHNYLKHTFSLPIFFSGNELKLVLMTENNQHIWQYWNDDRNQLTLANLFNPERLEQMTKPGMRGSNSVLYTFKHKHADKDLFFSMMIPEATRELRQLFWHVGAHRDSWKVFRISVFELNDEERNVFNDLPKETIDLTNGLTHVAMLQEISDHSAGSDYLLSEKPRLASSELKRFCHKRNSSHIPVSIYFDAQNRRKEPRYQFRSPLFLTYEDQQASGVTLDISKHGLYIALSSPIELKAGQICTINFSELQLYDKSLPLNKVPYKVIRVSPGGKRVQLVIEDTSKNINTMKFFGRLIEHNRNKLVATQETLPSNEMLENLHNILLERMISTPLFVEKKNNNLKPKVVGVRYPLPGYLALFAKVGRNNRLLLDSVYKGRTTTLLAAPMKRIEGAKPQAHELYISAIKFGTRLQTLAAKLCTEFESTRERIDFIKNSQNMGEFYAVRICSTPIFDPLTAMLRKDIEELTTISLHQARSLEKEISTLVGFSEFVDITEEVLIRLELTQ
ncbi:pilus assembly protein PilZ [Vibrio ponticus]|uniref:Pilus assembly protein PilZ n=1 Tax=Vibrio ponticus TaxID=265668 RepID=A0ABX3F9X6_9VIBR|nr:PilZ domain-containing protein [Vibrio ponticus]OLQ87724.1 pilus assembly protein PilZ [Vibrio ponticus]